MNHKSNYIFSNLFVLLLLTCFCLFVVGAICGCQRTENAKPKNTNLDTTEVIPDQLSHDLTIYFVDSSFNKATIFAKRGRVFVKENYSILDSGVKVIFYSSSGKQNGTLTAKQIKIDDLTKNMFASGNVLVISDSTKSQLETDELEWNNTNRKLYSHVFVKIISPREIINGWGFESNEDLSNYKIYKVSGIVSNE